MTGFPPPGAAGLVSVDVFDTVLVRRVGHPDGVFLLLGRQQAARQLTALAPEAFARARKDAQNRAHAAHRERVSHGHILAELGWALSLTAAQVEDLRSCELAIESAIMTAVPGAASWLDQLRDKAGGRVVFVSDTYFPAAFLRSLLEEQGMWQDGDGLYVSCEAGREKHTGRLLPVMARREGVARRLVHHYGNDAVADVSAARRAGVRATLVAEANLNRYEEILDRWRLPTGGLASLMAGASRLARLSVPAASDIDAAIRDVTAGVIAPTLVAYVLWVLADAARTGVRRLYFVSRDGEVLLRVARRLVDRTGSPAGLELRYLHGSRQAWSTPALQAVSPADLDWIAADPTFLSVRTALARVGVAPEEDGIEATLCAGGLPASGWDADLSPAGRDRLAGMLLAGPVHDAVLGHAAAARLVVQRYLGQEGMVDGGAYGLVDVGWAGRTGAAVDSVLRLAGAGDDRCFYYLGLRRRPAGPAGPLDLRPWLFDDGAGRGPDLRKVAVEPLVEAFCTGSHGIVLGYADTPGGGVAPVLKSARNDEAYRCGLGLLREVVDAFVDHLLLSGPAAETGADLRPAVAALLTEFGVHPTAVEARAWGRFPYSTDPNEASLRTLASPYTWAEAAGVLALGPLRRLPDRPWPEGSRRLSEPVVASVMGRPADFAARARFALARPVRRGR